jgi:nucleoside triphosphate diphosphatase
MPKPVYDISDLLRVMQRLRDPENGCPWDLEQTFQSIVPSTLEECYELADAIEAGDYPQVAEELGDVLFQVVFYARLGSEQGLFSFHDVVQHLVEKLLRRHPHVFGDGEIETVVESSSEVEEIGRSWEAIKREERARKAMTGLMDDIPLRLPALPRAQKLQRRAAQAGFDWQDSGGVLAKLQEEISELQDAIEVGQSAGIQNELGDVIFSCVNLARHLGEDAEASLRSANSKFEQRFRMMEQFAAESGLALEELDSEGLERLWERAKASETGLN